MIFKATCLIVKLNHDPDMAGLTHIKLDLLREEILIILFALSLYL